MYKMHEFMVLQLSQSVLIIFVVHYLHPPAAYCSAPPWRRVTLSALQYGADSPETVQNWLAIALVKRIIESNFFSSEHRATQDDEN